MRPYFIVLSGYIPERDETVEVLGKMAGMSRTRVFTNDYKMAETKPGHTFHNNKDYFKLGHDSMMLLTYNGGSVYGILAADVRNSDIIAVDASDAQRLKAFCIGYNRPCYIIGTGPMSDESKSLTDIYLEQPDYQVIMGFIISKMVKELKA